MRNEPMAPAAGGESSPSGIPEGMKPLEYPNNWDPKLVLPTAENISRTARRHLPEVEVGKVKRGKLIIVGSAPSVVDYIDNIREFKADKNNKVFCVNNAHALIQEHGIAPDGGLIFEIEKRAYDCLGNPHPDCTYYVTSFCDPYAFDSLAKHNAKVLVWHCASFMWCHVKALMEGFGKKDAKGESVWYSLKLLHDTFKGNTDQVELAPIIEGLKKVLGDFQLEMPLIVGGGFTTFLRTLNLGYVLGWRDYELFGFDSSFHEDEKTHFFGTPDYGGPIAECYAKTLQPTTDNPQGLKKYRSMAYLIRQADEFRNYCALYHDRFKMRVWGEGLLPDLHRSNHPEMYEDANERT